MSVRWRAAAVGAVLFTGAVAGCASRKPVPVIPLSPPDRPMPLPPRNEGWFAGLEGGVWAPTETLRVTTAGGGRIRSDGLAWTAGPYLGYRLDREVAILGGYQYARAEDWDVHLGHIGLTFGFDLPLDLYLRGSFLAGGPDVTSGELRDALKVDNFTWGLEGGAGLRVPLGGGWDVSADAVYRYLTFRISESPGTTAPGDLDLSGVCGFVRVGYTF